eukprot:gene4030-14109_t
MDSADSSNEGMGDRRVTPRGDANLKVPEHSGLSSGLPHDPSLQQPLGKLSPYFPRLTTHNMGVDWDKTLLLSSAVTSIGHGVPGLVTPTPLAKAFYTHPKNTSIDWNGLRYTGLGWFTKGALTLGLARDSVGLDTKKTAMKTLGCCWVGAATLNAANIINKKQKLKYFPRLTTHNMGVDWDRTLLMSSAVTSVGYGVRGVVRPTPLAKDFYAHPKNTSIDWEGFRYTGLGWFTKGALTLGLNRDNVGLDTKKTAMKTLGYCWVGAAALNAAHIINKKQKLEVGANLVWQGGLGSALLYRGYKHY